MVQGGLVGAADIHAGPAADRLQPFQHLDILGGIIGRCVPFFGWPLNKIVHAVFPFTAGTQYRARPNRFKLLAAPPCRSCRDQPVRRHRQMAARRLRFADVEGERPASVVRSASLMRAASRRWSVQLSTDQTSSQPSGWATSS